MSTWPWWVNWYLFIAIVVAVAALVRVWRRREPISLFAVIMTGLSWPAFPFLLLREISRNRRVERKRWEAAQGRRRKTRSR